VESIPWQLSFPVPWWNQDPGSLDAELSAVLSRFLELDAYLDDQGIEPPA
jgi:hypothetical protein